MEERKKMKNEYSYLLVTNRKVIIGIYNSKKEADRQAKLYNKEVEATLSTDEETDRMIANDRVIVIKFRNNTRESYT